MPEPFSAIITSKSDETGKEVSLARVSTLAGDGFPDVVALEVFLFGAFIRFTLKPSEAEAIADRLREAVAALKD